MKIQKAVIPAAGFGTRFLPSTKAQPKEMLNVVDKPLIQYSVEEAVQSKIKNILLISSRGKSSMEDHFDHSPELERFLKEKGKQGYLKEVKRIGELVDLNFIRQKEALGLGHAISLAQSYVGNNPFSVLLPDDIFDCPTPCISQLMDAFSKMKASIIVLGRVDREGTKKYGIIKPKQVSERIFQVEDLVEKPGPEKAYSDLGVLGRYVFTPEIFQAIKETKPDTKGEIQITDAIKHLLKSQSVYGYLFEGTRYDAGNKMGYLQATLSLALKRPDFKEQLKDYLKTVKVED
ncbi:UTP--glucose-1-phosphate uridylyltransferase GalU [bacterium]|nr:UTP--glucose-1-phosphate uridylyltransferase GalU [bacterium]